MADDGLNLFYAERLWSLIPPMYHSADVPEGDGGLGDPVGPLYELVGRLGAGIAAERRAIDALARLGSIETADDWAIPYIAQLLATRLVGSMDARAQRLDVARTIYYRRRAGTMGLIELLAFNVTGHDARAIEFFRRLTRTRHGFDPAIAGDRELLVAERLVGRTTETPAGGTADLRDAWGASASTSAFDEFSHTADFRRPRQATGHHAIPRIGIWLWWLYSYLIDGATPVQRKNCPNEYSFEPTGRDIPLRGSGGRTRAILGESWTSPDPWDLPLAIGNLLWAAEAERFYPDQIAVLLAGGGVPGPALLSDLAIDVERGRFRFPNGAPVGEFLSRYHHGFAGPVGAQGQPDQLPPVPDEPKPPIVVAGGTLGSALASPVATRAVLFNDSRTYAGPAGPIVLNSSGKLVLRAISGRRPLIRWSAAATLVVNGGDAETELVIRGLHWQGADIELAGTFRRVTIEQATIDPGSLDSAGAVDTAIDGVPLGFAAIVISGDVGELVINRAITGPIRVSGAGVVAELRISDSIVQSIDAAVPALELDAGWVAITRSTILGAGKVHQLNASGSIFDQPIMVEDAQHGCVRFCTYAEGSLIHAPYRSVAIPPHSPIFHSRRFGNPGYARLRDNADCAIAAPQPGQSIRAGGEDGSETGAFATERATLKTRSLMVKLEEFMPIGTIPVLIDAG